MNRTALHALLSHWWRQPVQLATLLAGLALATGLWTGVQAINTEARASYDSAAQVLDQGRRAALVPNAGNAIPLASYAALRRAGWPVAPLLEGHIDMGQGTPLRVTGVDFLATPPSGDGAGLGDGAGIGDDLDPYAPLIAPGTGLADAPTVARLQRVDVADLPHLVVSTKVPPGTLLTDIAVAERLLDRRGTLDRLILTGPPPDSLHDRPPHEPEADLLRTLGLRLVAPEAGGDIGALTASFHLNLTAFGLLAFAVGLFIVHGTIGLAFEQRRPMLRTLRALGVPARRLIALILAELLVLGLIAGALGVALGYGIAALLLPDVAATLQGLYGATVAGTLQFRPEWWLSGLGIALAGTLLAAAQGLWQVWRLPLLAAAQPRAWARASAQVTRRLALAGAVLLGAAAAGAMLADGLIAGFAALGALLLGAALVLPWGLSLVLGMAEQLANRRSGTPIWSWFFADTRQQLPGLSLALMALLLALAANVGVATMVSSFRLTFTGWLDQRLAAELYVTARTEDEAARLRDWLMPRVDAVLPIWNAEIPVAGRPTEIYGVADHATYRDNWPVLSALPDAWDLVAAGGAAMLNEQMARAQGLGSGDTLIAGPLGEVTIAGIYSDYGNTAPQMLISVPALTRAFPDVARLRYGVRLAPGRAEALAQSLTEDFGLPSDNIRDQASIKALSLSIFERTFAVTGALGVLTLSVAGFAMLTSLLTLSQMRLPQLAPVWALGVTRARLGWMEAGRSLTLAALTWVLAVPVGLVLAWMLLAVVNVAAFGWRLPMAVFPAQWLTLLALALLAAGLASALPLRRLMRMPPAGFLKVFANER